MVLLRISMVLVLVAALVACGDDDDAPPSAGDVLATTIAPADLDGPLPPVDAINAEALFGDDFADLGLRLTNRGGLIDRTDGGYVKSPEGDHYALYVEPTGDDFTAADYARNLVPLAALVGPELMRRYPDLVSYDICQEPADNDELYPTPVTQIEFDRDIVESVDWDDIDVEGLLALRARGGIVNLTDEVAEAAGVA